MNRARFIPLLTLVSAVVLTWGFPLGAQPPEEDEPMNTPQSVVAELYDLVSFEAGAELPDWDRVRSLFIPEAVIVLRTTRESTTVFSLEGFVEDFVTFIDRAKAGERGFTETILRTKATVFGDIAHILVLYEPRLGGSEREPIQGVDSFQLIRQDGQWRIAAVVNEIVTPERPIPPELRD